MRTGKWVKIGLAALLAIVVIGSASWWESQRPYITPGDHRVFRECSNAGAMAGFLIFIAAAIPGMAALLRIHDGKFRDAVRAGRVCAAIIVPYLAALVLVSLLTPRTVVNIGDSYCYDLWCVGVNQVDAIPGARDIRYDVRVTAFVDSGHAHRLPASEAASFFYVLDDQGRRYGLARDASFVGADVTVQPGETVKSSFAFLAAASARKLYLVGDDYGWLPWVYLYFGGDFSLFHRPAAAAYFVISIPRRCSRWVRTLTSVYRDPFFAGGLSPILGALGARRDWSNRGAGYPARTRRGRESSRRNRSAGPFGV